MKINTHEWLEFFFNFYTTKFHRLQNIVVENLHVININMYKLQTDFYQYIIISMNRSSID